MGDIMFFPRIRDLREDNDKKQIELAKYLNIDQSTYSDYENGKINIPIEQLIKIADFYNVSLDYLVGRDRKKGDIVLFPRIRELREDHDKKQLELTNYLHIMPNTYSDYENGKINIPIEQLIKIADFYDVSLDYLVSRDRKTI